MRARTPLVIACLTLAGALAHGQAPPDRRVLDAAREGVLAAVRALLGDPAGRAAVDASDAGGATALHRAVERGDAELVALLIDAGADPTAVTRYRVTPLALAASSGRADIVTRLLDAGADPNEASQEGQTALMSAALGDSAEAVALLTSRGARVDDTEPVRGQTALMWASGRGSAAAVDALVAAGADVALRSSGGFTALLFAILNDQQVVAERLLAHGADANAVAPDGTTVLNMAIVNAYYDLAWTLLDHGARADAPDPRGSPLHTLAWLRKPGATGTAAVGGEANGPPVPTGEVTALELARKLLEHGVDPNVRVDWEERRFNKDGAAVTNPPDVALGRHLLTYNGATAFWVAANNGDAPLMRILLEGGADPSIPSRFGVTPLMVAAGLNYYEGESPGPFTGTSEAERLDAVKIALAAGNEVNAKADFGDYEMTGDPAYTLLYYPLNIDDLVDLGVGDPRWDGCTALHGSILTGQPSIVRFLLEQGADIDATCDLGWTPLMLARGVFLANAEKVNAEAEAILTEALRARGLPVPPPLARPPSAQ
jgi:ankyrin repeat protein